MRIGTILLILLGFAALAFGGTIDGTPVGDLSNGTTTQADYASREKKVGTLTTNFGGSSPMPAEMQAP